MIFSIARELCDLARRTPIVIGRRKHASMLPEKRPNRDAQSRLDDKSAKALIN